MKAVSHHRLGQYLAEQYMPDAPRRYKKIFLLGCIEPDKNPTTYLKGSIRCQWLRGHNWDNASRYIRRISRRLEKKERFRLKDFYNLGKLIHYTADAFTYTHNSSFHAGLNAHRHYEKVLHRYFSYYLENACHVQPHKEGSVIDAIVTCHNDYLRENAGIRTDAAYSMAACHTVLHKLLQSA